MLEALNPENVSRNHCRMLLELIQNVMEDYISTTGIQDWFKIRTKDYYSIKCHSGFSQEEECVNKVWLDILGFTVSVGGIEILVSLIAIDHLLFYCRGVGPQQSFSYIFLSKSQYNYSCSGSLASYLHFVFHFHLMNCRRHRNESAFSKTPWNWAWKYVVWQNESWHIGRTRCPGFFIVK